MKLYSFDVFDTLITRSTVTPDGIFAVMQNFLNKDASVFDGIDDFVRNNFYHLRIGAEQVARNTFCVDGIEDVTLGQIYEVLVIEGQISKDQSKFLQNLEKRTEIDFSIGISENILKIKELIEAGKRVVLISDMYLDRDTIREMLVKADEIFQNIPIYVSSDKEKKNKWTGSLFRLVQEQEQVAYSEWQHMGDNEHSDYNVPRGLGISCIKYQSEQLLPIEERYLRNNESDAEVQLSLGCARAARIAGKRNTAFRMGCSVGGSILYKYVCWMLQDSVEKGIRRLYFIARDGYALKELADKLICQNGYPIETSYIFGSRLAWRIPCGAHPEEELWEIYTHSYQDRIFCAGDLSDFFGIQEELICKYLPAGLRGAGKIWTVAVTDLVVQQLLCCKAFMEELMAQYDRKRALLLRYLQQEIDTEDDNFAFVDLAGSGFTQECLARVMGEYYHGEIKNYFFRQDKTANTICQNFVFYPNRLSYFVLLEMVSRAPHGQTLGYKEEAGRIVPVLSEIDDTANADHHIEDFIDGIRAYGQIYDEKGQMGQIRVGIGNIYWYLDYIYNTPDKEVLEYFAEMPNMLTGREKCSAPFAPKLTDKDIRNIYWYRDREAMEYYYAGTDIVYSLRRCTKRQLHKIDRYNKYKNTRYGKWCRTVHKCLRRGKGVAKTATIYDYIWENIVIYGAGKKGKLFYDQMTGKAKVNGQRYVRNIVAWIDQNYAQYQEQGLAVSSLDKIQEVEFDQVIIAIARRDVAAEIKKMLMQRGIPENKITWIKSV